MPKKVSEKNKRDFVGGKYLVCIESFSSFEKGKSYWFEYIGKDRYRGRSDNILGKVFEITPCELVSCFGQRYIDMK